MKTRLIKLKTMFPSAMTMLYFVMVVIHNIYQGSIINYCWYVILFGCFLLGILKKRLIVSYEFVVVIGLFILCGLMNYFIVGNQTLSAIAFFILYCGVYMLLSDDLVDEQYVMVSIYLDCFIIVFALFNAGLGNPIFEGLSNNFVSVLLLLPTVVYYIKAEYRKKQVKIMPAVAVALTCLCAMGRGGILASGLLLLMILGYLIFSDSNWSSKARKSLFRFSVFTLTIVLTIIAIKFSDHLQAMTIFDRFSKYGMYGTGRAGIWKEYISTMSQSVVNVLFGVKYSELPLMVRYRNNLHNSYLNLHADFGLLILILVAFLVFSDYKRIIKGRRWIYFSVMTVFLIRAFTDRMFGGGYVATPILLFILLFIRDKDYMSCRSDMKWSFI